MPLPTLEELRLQCRIDSDEEDALLQAYLEAAKEKAINYLNRNVYEEDVPDSDPEGIRLTPLIKLALMLAVGFWYETRDPKRLPPGFRDLLDDYRIRPV
ncbi:head-tail connector protein [Xenorhabdus bovienii]|uniref:Head-tail connector protein n=2 Tax=Xenorhabdus bovienii TaxID=40576 RepID=A0AAJ1JAX7_XENBV|nr:head-tail connector protein [Xenorhabdus bovienii]MDE1480362.1 head-tail connector protein [Xenorhabdus bovienii]MDE9483888.1 head-tail connector protein [Xenorhabdus bovienii]MDE9495829.1 head-tail connector protein [Xenorhabdus bovienii]MDE9504223.1 head-tail connector protein [Xenorhabdus bovienii]MDE9512043.1 head-tail connector protein [Xenorhabdus bovienii]